MLHALPHVADGDEVDLDPSGHWVPEHHGHVGCVLGSILTSLSSLLSTSAGSS